MTHNDSLHERGKAAENIWARGQESEDLARFKSKMDPKQLEKLHEKAST